ncbi:Mycothiol S-conjugate amidase [Maioricimonas rarisocia]|uniref:Mycothiol S-conjugate amidase n=2 Tax=Maioricimonas rarisocia TaxID=2528026 RepID=A0A517Z9H1_9PLAN|nr:Mycothiol S-conjugate amidase [Maioricimonas rarisocia]
MRLDFSGETVLAIVAHPDDAELLCAGTLARARNDGADVAIAVLCQGDKGQPAEAIADLAAVRREEMKAAAEVLGARLLLGERPDSGLVDDLATRQLVVELIRSVRPTLVLAHAPDDYHADHRAASCLAEATSWTCASNGWDSQQPALDAPPAVWWMDTVGMHDFEPGFYVDVSNVMETKENMLQEHTSQLRRSGDGDFAPLLDLMRQQAEARGMQCGVAAAECFRIHRAFKRVSAW